MVNILGNDGYTGTVIYEGLDEIMKLQGVKVYLYGKKVTKPHRKMGHITIVDDDINTLKIKVNKVKELIKVRA